MIKDRVRNIKKAVFSMTNDLLIQIPLSKSTFVWSLDGKIDPLITFVWGQVKLWTD